MIRRATVLLTSLALLPLSACGPADGDPGAGGVTASDAEALDEAAQKLDERDQSAADETKK